VKILGSMAWKKTLEILDRIEFFNAFSIEEKEMLATFHGRFYSTQSNETIIKEGDSIDTLFVLLSGQVNVYKGRSKESLAVLTPGDIFGEISFITKTQRISSVVASEPCIVLEIDHAMLTVLNAEIREKIKDQIIIKLVKRLDLMNARLYDISQKSDRPIF